MKTVMIEAIGTGGNWGKFLVGRLDTEWAERSKVARDHLPLMTHCGWTAEHLLVLDMQTGEGAIFRPGGLAKADLDKHRIWVCPLFEPFLEWLYEQDLSDLGRLPLKVEIEHGLEFSGYRRGGP